jgi:hypothetical protein
LSERGFFCQNVFAFVPTSVPTSKNIFSLKINMRSDKRSDKFLQKKQLIYAFSVG